MKGFPILLRDKGNTGDKERWAGWPGKPVAARGIVNGRGPRRQAWEGWSEAEGLPANLPADDHKQKGPADFSVGPSKNGIGAERLLPSLGRGKGVGRKTRQLPFEVYGRRSRL